MKSEMRKIIIDREQQNIPDWLKKFTPPMANLDTMLETIETWDIEGLVIKAIEVLDNMRHPNPENEAATFIDAMEMIYFYAPLLEIAGFDNLASDCYSIAYEYLYTDEFSKKELETIKSIREKAKTAQETFNSKIIPEIQNQLQLQEKGINRNTINARVKTTGSILKKICEARPELERKNIVPPDILAFTIIIDEEHNNLDTIDSILSMIITILHEYGYHTGHSRDEAQIEYSAKEHNKKYSSIPYGEKKYYHYSINLNLSDYPQEWINIDFEESKSSGLQLIHCSFMNKDPHKMPEEDRKIKLDTDTITVEVRIITEEMHTSSNHGEHSHPIYKSSKDPNSKLNQLKQASTQNDNDKKAFEEEKERIIKIQQTIRLRGKIFTNTQDTLKANEASRIKAENMFNMIC
jgi:(p)ppGpp synthase/HD superfamily hydrolase